MTPTWHRQWLEAARQRFAELTAPPDEPITFADWVDDTEPLAGLADRGDQPWTPTVPNILHDQPPTGLPGCKVFGPNCMWFRQEREAVELEHIIDNAADLAYAEAWRAYPHKAWT